MSRKEDFIQAGIDYRMEHGKPMCIAGSNLADVERDLNRVMPFEAGAEYGYQYAQTHPNWISVEDELPKENEEVLAYNSLYNEKYLCVYHNGKFEDYLGELGKGAVSHWMPIVPPRKEE